MRLRFACRVEGHQTQTAKQRGIKTVAGAGVKTGLAQKFTPLLFLQLPQFSLERRRHPEDFQTPRLQGLQFFGSSRLRRLLGGAIDDQQRRFLRQETEVRKGLLFLRAELKHTQRGALIKAGYDMLERSSLNLVRRALLFDPLQAALGLLVVGKHQFFFDRLDRGQQRSAAGGGTGYDNQQRVQFTHERNQAGVEHRGGFGLFKTGREVDHGQFDGHLFFRFTDPREKIQARIGDANLTGARAIFGLRWEWSQTGESGKNG